MNIVFITSDAWRYDALGVAPDKHRLSRYNLAQRLHTPNLDRFASEGAYFSNAFVTAPHTPPSHASIMTGLYPPQHGVRSFCYERLPPHLKTLAEVLRGEGYATITLRESEDISEPGILEKVDVLRGFENTVHTLDDFAAASRRAHQAGCPVFAFVHLWDLHAPYLYSDWARKAGWLDPLWDTADALSRRWHVPYPDPDQISEKAWIDFQRAVAARIADTDLRIRTLLELYVEGVNWFDRHRWPAVESTLKEGGLWDDTVVFVFADHGEGVHPDGRGFNVVGHGQSLLDDLLRVPLLVRGLPGVAPRQIDAQVSLVDLAPTVLDILGLEAADPLGLNAHESACGQSLMPLVRSATSQHARSSRFIFAELCRGAGAEQTLVPQYLYQRCARGNGHKLLCHNGPIWMGRYVDWRDSVARRWRGGLRRLGMTSGSPSVVVEDGAECDRLHWVDLGEDPDEQHPQSWGGAAPLAVRELRAALDGLYGESIRGPAITSDEADESALRRRLAALGYIEE